VHFPDTPLWFPDVHNGIFGAPLVVHVIHRSERVALGDSTVRPDDEPILEEAFARWARRLGEPLPYLEVVDGKLLNHHLREGVDLVAAPHREAVGGGFERWEAGRGWLLAGAGELELVATGPTLRIALAPDATAGAAAPGPAAVEVTVVDDAIGFSVAAGRVELAGGPVVAELDAGRFLRTLGNGRPVRVRLEVRGGETPGPGGASHPKVWAQSALFHW
jgi:hypothetical protein